MKIIDIENCINNNHETAIALGNFDGIHIGHQKLINSVVDISKTYNLKAGVLLFENHTKEMIEHKNIKLLTTNKQKLELFAELGIDMVFKAKFTKELRSLPPEKFVKDILIDKLNTKFITVGFNYRFGYKARGDVDLLKILGNKYGFSVYIIEPQYMNNKIISSTAIRKYLNAGDLEKANIMLNRNYSVIAALSMEKSWLKEVIYPRISVNILNKYMVPKKGVYITRCKFKNNNYLALTNILTNPTFEVDNTKAEIYLNKYEEINCNDIIEIEFIEYIREATVHESQEEFIKYIYEDIEYAKSKY